MARPKVIHDAFTAIADPTRRRILDVLREGDCTVGALHARLPISQPTISEHLKVLRNVGLVAARRSGRQRIYSLRPAGLADVQRWLAAQNGHAPPHIERIDPPARAVHDTHVPGNGRAGDNGRADGNGHAPDTQAPWSPEID